MIKLAKYLLGILISPSSKPKDYSPGTVGHRREWSLGEPGAISGLSISDYRYLHIRGPCQRISLTRERRCFGKGLFHLVRFIRVESSFNNRAMAQTLMLRLNADIS